MPLDLDVEREPSGMFRSSWALLRTKLNPVVRNPSSKFSV